MSPILAGICGILIMLLMFMTRMPVAFVMALVGFAGFSLMVSPSAALVLLSRNVYETFASYDLTTIPLFILMGQLGFNSGISKRLYDAGYKFLGSVRGGLAMATVSACTAFGAVCGSSPATAATMATVGLPEMKRFGYDDELAAGAVASGGGIGMIMPPSVSSRDQTGQCPACQRVWANSISIIMSASRRFKRHPASEFVMPLPFPYPLRRRM